MVRFHPLTCVPPPRPLGFLIKCIQLYETTVVRHGLMLVGPTGSGKSNVSRAKHGRGWAWEACISIKGISSTCTPLMSGLPSPLPVVPQPTAFLLSENQESHFLVVIPQCYRILAAAMTSLKGKPSISGGVYEAVNYYVLNPKSITMGQLYGEFDLLTHEW